MSVEKIERQKAWAVVGATTGGTAVSIPGDISEIEVDVQYGSSNLYFPFHFIKDQLAQAAKNFTIGYYINATTTGFCQVLVSSDSIKVNALYISGTDHTTSARMRVFAK